MIREIEIVDASPDDAPDVGRLQTEVWRSTYLNPRLGITAQAIEEKLREFNDGGDERLRDKIRATGSRTWVAKDDKGIVGFIGVHQSADSNVIEALHITPTHQGLGIGHRLMQRALAWLGSSTPIVLDVVAYNERAIHFYDSYDFKQTGGLESCIALAGGVTIPLRRMVRA
jgi:ribosomal protein S18 acetylase RimI-like enzyme